MNHETESALLGALIVDPSQVDVVESLVSSVDFYDPDLGRVFAMLQDMHAAGEPVGDVVLVSRRLSAASLLDKIGGMAGLGALAMSTGDARNAGRYAVAIRKSATLRRLQMIGSQITARCGGVDAEPSDVAAWAEGQLRACASAGSAKESITMATAAFDALSEIDAAKTRGRACGVPTGLLNVDSALGGFQPGELVILAARPSIGKSALAAQIAAYNAQRDRPVLFVSLEMSSGDIAIRAIAGEIGVDSRVIRSGMMSDREREAAGEYAESISSQPFYLWSSRSVTTSKIRAAAKLQAATCGLSLLVVDYLGLVHATDRRRARWEQITEVSNDLKSLALEMGIPVLALCQLNRDAEKNAPRLDHLRDAGAIEQDADVVMLLHRESRDSNDATLDIAKSRNGVTGSVGIGFDCQRVRFTDAMEWEP